MATYLLKLKSDKTPKHAFWCNSRNFAIFINFSLFSLSRFIFKRNFTVSRGLFALFLYFIGSDDKWCYSYVFAAKLNIKYVVLQALNLYGGAWLLIVILLKQICSKRNFLKKIQINLKDNFLYQTIKFW